MGRLSDIPLEIAERLDYPAESVAGRAEADRDRPGGVRWWKTTMDCSHTAASASSLTAAHAVCLRGTDLQLVAMDSAAVLISGTIVCAEFA